MSLLNKYELDFTYEDVKNCVLRLTNQLWKLIPMRENGEDWNRQIKTVIIELVGMNEIFENPMLIQLLSKLEGICIKELEFEIYRKTIFECINLLQGALKKWN